MERDTYAVPNDSGRSRASAAKIDDDRDGYRKAAEHFAIAAKFRSQEADASTTGVMSCSTGLWQSGDGAPEVMTRARKALLNRAVVKYRAALVIDPQFQTPTTI